jgi:hypothetical protein
MVLHETGNGLFAYPRGRPGREIVKFVKRYPVLWMSIKNCVNFVLTMELVIRKK